MACGNVSLFNNERGRRKYEKKSNLYVDVRRYGCVAVCGLRKLDKFLFGKCVVFFIDGGSCFFIDGGSGNDILFIRRGVGGDDSGIVGFYSFRR